MRDPGRSLGVGRKARRDFLLGSVPSRNVTAAKDGSTISPSSFQFSQHQSGFTASEVLIPLAVNPSPVTSCPRPLRGPSTSHVVPPTFTVKIQTSSVGGPSLELLGSSNPTFHFCFPNFRGGGYTCVGKPFSWCLPGALTDGISKALRTVSGTQ